MILKRFAAVIAAAVMCLGLAGCQKDSGGGSSPEPAEENSSNVSAGDSSSEAEKEEKIPETKEEWHQAMLDKSMTSYGNTTRMVNKIKQAQSGEKVTVAYIGGSITEGLTAGPEDCYAKLSYNYFAETFGTGDNVEYVNAGLSGTPSRLGNLRLERDVLQYDPDIVFIEFAVNDGTDATYQDAYESMVRTLLADDNDIAVVLLMSITEDGHTAQDYMKTIGNYYQLPIISYADALTYMFENGGLTWEDFSDDQSHPNPDGHVMVSKMIINYFDTVSDQPQEAEQAMPQMPVFTARQVGAKLMEGDSYTPVSLGSFNEGSSIARFTHGWTYFNDGKNEPAVFEVSGKFIYLIFKENSSGNLGVAHVVVKSGGEVVSEYDVNGIQSGGWGDPGIVNLVMDVELKDYTIEVSMAEGSEDKQFEILGFGYTE